MYVWITTITKEYAILIVGELVAAGFKVSPLDSKNKLSHTSGMTNIISFQLDTKEGVNEVKNAVLKILNSRKMLYYSIVVADNTPCIWAAGNIDFESDDLEQKLESYLSLLKTRKLLES